MRMACSAQMKRPMRAIPSATTSRPRTGRVPSEKADASKAEETGPPVPLILFVFGAIVAIVIGLAAFVAVKHRKSDDFDDLGED